MKATCTLEVCLGKDILMVSVKSDTLRSELDSVYSESRYKHIAGLNALEKDI